MNNPSEVRLSSLFSVSKWFSSSSCCAEYELLLNCSSFKSSLTLSLVIMALAMEWMVIALFTSGLFRCFHTATFFLIRCWFSGFLQPLHACLIESSRNIPILMCLECVGLNFYSKYFDFGSDFYCKNEVMLNLSVYNWLTNYCSYGDNYCISCDYCNFTIIYYLKFIGCMAIGS